MLQEWDYGLFVFLNCKGNVYPVTSWKCLHRFLVCLFAVFIDCPISSKGVFWCCFFQDVICNFQAWEFPPPSCNQVQPCLPFGRWASLGLNVVTCTWWKSGRRGELFRLCRILSAYLKYYFFLSSLPNAVVVLAPLSIWGACWCWPDVFLKEAFCLCDSNGQLYKKLSFTHCLLE